MTHTNTKQTTDWVVWRSNCFSKTDYHFRKHRHWLKRVVAVDTSRCDGFAFIGDFLPIRREMKMLVGDVIIEACGNKISAYCITEAGKVMIGECERNAMSGLIDKVAKIVNSKKEGKK
jgi:hypothetical protein